MALVLVLAAVAVAGWYGWRRSLRKWPYAPCKACQGRAGRNEGSNRDRWGACRVCGGSGRRLRRGARAALRQ